MIFHGSAPDRQPPVDAESCVRADAALVRAFDLLGRRWTGVLLGTLSGGPAGFRALSRAVDGISDSMLSDRLSAALQRRARHPHRRRGTAHLRRLRAHARQAVPCCPRSNRSPAGQSSTSLQPIRANELKRTFDRTRGGRGRLSAGSHRAEALRSDGATGSGSAAGQFARPRRLLRPRSFTTRSQAST